MMRRTFLPALSMIRAATAVKMTWMAPTMTEARSLSWRTATHQRCSFQMNGPTLRESGNWTTPSPWNEPVRKCSQRKTWWHWFPSSAEKPSAWSQLPGACRRRGPLGQTAGNGSPGRRQAGDKAPLHFILWDPGYAPNTHHFVTGVFNAGAFVLDGRIGSPHEAQGLLGLSPLALWQQETRRLRHKAHADHEERGRDGAADRQPAPVQEKTCGERLQTLLVSAFILPLHLLWHHKGLICRTVKLSHLRWF